MAVFMFPGQGSQQKGMGSHLFDHFPEFLSQADAILGYSLQELCLNDPQQLLSQTQYTQPALFVVNALTHLQFFLKHNQYPHYLIGHSLGEYNALFAAGVF